MTWLYLCDSYMGLLLNMALQGSLLSGRITGIFVHVTENLKTEHQHQIGYIWSVFDGITLLLATAYFQFISKDWRQAYFYLTLFQGLMTLLAFKFVVESPVFLLNKNRHS